MRFRRALVVAAVPAALLCFPLLHLALALVNFGLHLVVLGFQWVACCLPRIPITRREDTGEEPFVSIHVPTHNEPPEVVEQTLQALVKLKWTRYEVLVIDNNTPDESVWRPVEELCRRLGPQFRFLHVEGLSGAKAGAMNWARPLTDPRADFIFVVDADYVVEPDALQVAFSYVTDSRIGLVQFPQEYRNTGPENLGLSLDFRHFFAGYMNLANRLGCVPSTGTLSLIRVSALESVRGFNTGVITEDTDLGYRLAVQGVRSVYAHRVIGRGLMPHDLESLKRQRWRWAFGNAQILKLNWRGLLMGRELTLRQKAGFLIHLTAWFNFNLLPSLTLILIAPLAALGWMHPYHPYLAVLSGFTLTTFVALRFGTLFYSLRHEGHGLRGITLAFLTHLGLGWIFAASWIRCLIDHQSPFLRTNKFLTTAVPGLVRTTLIEAALGIGLLAASVILTLNDFFIAPIAALVFGV
ncbi:MAG: glycosyltransferase, partial [Verrucomicrobiales bacterium]|nr:glycosyltransferase [Verrucomicrobiales bacterium]